LFASHARDFDGYDNTDLTQTDLGNESVESDPRNSSTAATHAQVIIDHDDLGSRPAQVDSPIHKAVLQALALPIVQDLAGRGLTDVDRGLTSKMGGCDLCCAHG